ncbi:hypothetical protein EDC04DRAFT_1826250 [Pisolithus marmoratus]|nr:hypothetical protein EDC04DRAFT_1826250 [Pisolithus marmoratus]
MAEYIRSIDPNHLISSGNQGFMCTDCPKLFPLNPTPPPQPSPAPGSKKRSVPVTSKQILSKRAESRRLNRRAAKLAGQLKEDGIRVRGRWAATATRRQQSQEVGSAYDGSYGVDSQDIMNIPDISFGSFQLFPDQDTYAPSDPSLIFIAKLTQLWCRMDYEPSTICCCCWEAFGHGRVWLGHAKQRCLLRALQYDHHTICI